ncbi:MAG: membrane protein insertion efficiency factor YidD [Fibrobacter sp.]|nr:membrane protein insertion efficiency factor YidD [Fibrobacter sp.]
MAEKNKKIIKIIIKNTVRIIKNLFLIPDGTCRYNPTCTEYAVEAIEKYSLFKAIIKIIWRILRCNPFSKGGYDPNK